MHFLFFHHACQQDSVVVESLSTVHRGVFILAKAWFIGKINSRVRLHRECAEYPAIQTICEMLSFPRGW